jgi:hypothetical protein
MNEIITFGHGYDLTDGIKIFVKSAKKFCNRLTIILSDPTDKLKHYLTLNNVNIVNSKELADKHNIQTSISPYTLKVIYFYIYTKFYSTASNVYLCDFTDVYIQKNPFNLIKNTKPYISSENYVIKNCQTNSTWINLCYNKDIYNLLKHFDILNGGSILGNKESCVNLLKEMCADMIQIISRIGNYQNIDQASLNKTVYFDLYRYNILNDFEIFNLAHFSNASVEYGDIIKINKHEPCIIHQYDVIKELENYLYVQFER